MKKKAKWPSAAVLLILLAGSCARISVPEPGVQTGLASWYGPKFHGKMTSSREVFNMYDLTAAHRSLPFGSHVMVTNLDNGKSVIVRINDRGPFVKGRIIDLSYAAARALDMVAEGVVPVRLELLPRYGRKPPRPTFSVQVGAFVKKSNATRLKKALEKRFSSVRIEVFRTPHQVYYRVRIRAKTRSAAEDIASRLAGAGYVPIIFEDDPD